MRRALPCAHPAEKWGGIYMKGVCFMQYRKGIDVSKWQGGIDWEKVKGSGIEFAMLRAGYGRGNIDAQFERNAAECERLGIPYGAYWFTYAYTPEMAAAEAASCLEAVKGRKLSYPVAYDFEGDSVEFAEKSGAAVTRELASAMARAFCGAVRAGGRYPMIYTNPSFLQRYFDAQLPREYDIWLAQWPAKPDPAAPPALATGMWQYSSSGSVDGIEGRVDLDAAYKDYPALTGGGSAPADTTEAERARDWVMKKGISDGTSPDAPATRQQVWVMLYRMNGGK